MTNEEAFEKWAIDYGLDYEPSFTRYDVEASWQAATAERDKLVTEQQATIAELKAYKNGQAKLIHQQNAHINDLREALEKAMNEEAGWYEIAKQALSATPAESLVKRDDELHEKLETALTSLRKYENGI